MKKLRRFYSSLKLQTKFTITHLVIATIPMIVIGIFFYARLYDMIVSDTIRTEQNSSARTAPLIDGLVDEILDAHNTVATQDFYLQITAPGRTAQLNDLAHSGAAAKFQKTLTALKEESQITDIHIFLDIPSHENIFTSPSTYSTFLPISYAQGTYWYGIFKGSSMTRSLFCPSFYLSNNEIRNYGDLAYITRAAVNYGGKQVPCYTAVYFSGKPLTELLTDNLQDNTSVAYLINERDSMIATSNEGLSGTYHFDYDTVQDSFMSSNNFILKHVLGEDVYAGFYSIQKADWYMVVAMPSRPMLEKSLSVLAGFVLVYAACIFTAFLIATRLSRPITNRLSAVINQMAGARCGPPAPMEDTGPPDEIGELIGTYNYMTMVINQLIEEQAKAAEDLRIAEFNSLQAQINPHFLYNTMDMINWLAQQGRTAEVTSAIQSLSKFYKLTLSRKQNISTIENETKHASIYVQLQNMRFHDTIDFIVDIPDYLMDYSMPKLTFQPVIENSIIHGILEKESRQGTIVLTGWLEDDKVVILVSDDGIGISEENIESILSGRVKNSKGTNIAVCNTHRRLQLLYGPEYGMHYTSTLGQGTEVQICIPARAADHARLNQALELLVQPEKNLFQIVEACGYSDMNEFSREFKERLGYSPEEYRRQML